MNALVFDGCWLVGGILAGVVLFKGLHAGWFTVTLRPRTDHEQAETWRKAQIDAAFRTHGQKILRSDVTRRMR